MMLIMYYVAKTINECYLVVQITYRNNASVISSFALRVNNTNICKCVVQTPSSINQAVTTCSTGSVVQLQAGRQHVSVYNIEEHFREILTSPESTFWGVYRMNWVVIMDTVLTALVPRRTHSVVTMKQTESNYCHVIVCTQGTCTRVFTGTQILDRYQCSLYRYNWVVIRTIFVIYNSNVTEM